jgi:hypothetical protein
VIYLSDSLGHGSQMSVSLNNKKVEEWQWRVLKLVTAWNKFVNRGHIFHGLALKLIQILAFLASANSSFS